MLKAPGGRKQIRKNKQFLQIIEKNPEPKFK
jgi:hypothetical protein